VVLLAWLSKLDVSGLAHLDFVSRAAIGSVPGWLVCLGVITLYGWLVYVAATARRCYSLGGDAECD
jgi:uncharacterized membrane protein